MRVRSAVAVELDELMTLFDSAKAFMRQRGNAGQWKDYPPRELIAADIAAGECFVLEEEETVQGVFVFSHRRDEEYERSEAGFDGGAYATVHRLASAGKRQGVFLAALDYATAHADCLRVDTHVNNLVIREKLAAYGFVQKGRLERFGEQFLTYEWRKKEK